MKFELSLHAGPPHLVHRLKAKHPGPPRVGVVLLGLFPPLQLSDKVILTTLQYIRATCEDLRCGWDVNKYMRKRAESVILPWL